MSARPLAFLLLLFAYPVKGTTGQDGAELAATALHSRLAKYDSNFRLGYGQALTGTRYPTLPGFNFYYPYPTRKSFENFRVQGSNYT